MCIICAWARLAAPLTFLMLQISWFLFFFIFRPFISLDFSIQSNFNPSFFWKYAPRQGRKHNSRDRHTPTWTLKVACSARSCALLKASWYRLSDFDPPSRQGLIAKYNSKLCIIFTIFFFCDLLWQVCSINLSFLRRVSLYFQDFSILPSSFAVFPCDMKPRQQLS